MKTYNASDSPVLLDCTLECCLVLVAKADSYELSSTWAILDESLPPPILHAQSKMLDRSRVYLHSLNGFDILKIPFL